MIYLMLFFALLLSVISGFYSIAGLISIFAASPIPIAIMGSALEGAKLVVASWLYRNWDEVPMVMKTYFIIALLILMFLSSMGIFGFLSRAHIDQGVPSSDITAKVALIDEKIKTERENIELSRQTLAQLDKQVNETLNRTQNDTHSGNVNKAVTIRQQQAKERANLAKQIETSQSIIATLNEQRAPIASELRKVEAEVGPIKYIAALIYGDEATNDTNLLERAVRWVIILIVIVFDPLAVIMLIAANWSFVHSKKPKEEPIKREYKEEINDYNQEIKTKVNIFEDGIIKRGDTIYQEEIRTFDNIIIEKTTQEEPKDEKVEQVILPNPTLPNSNDDWRSRPNF